MNKTIVVLLMFFFACIPVASAQSDLYYLTEITSTSFLPTEIRAGDTVSMAVDIKNRGSTLSISDLKGELDTGNQFEAIKASDEISVLAAGATKTLVFKFKAKTDTLPGYYPVFLTMNYTRNSEEVMETQSIFVPVSKTDKNIDVTLKPSVINPGKQTELVFTLKNVGGTPASNISFSWEEANDLVLPLGSDNKRYASVLQAGNEAQLFYNVAADPNITPGIYPLDITMTFTDVNGTKTQVSQVGLIVGGTTDFEVSAETLSGGQLSVSIANIGSNNAGAVVVRIPQQPSARVSGNNVAILGNLNKGDFTLANFEVQSQPFSFDQNNSENQRDQFRRTSNANNLMIEIDYTDTTGERQSVQKTIELAPSFSATSENAVAGAGGFRQRANPFSLAPWILMVLIVGGAIVFNKFKAKNSDWKKLGKILVISVALFLVVVFLLDSNFVATIIAGIISVGLLAWFFLKKKK